MEGHMALAMGKARWGQVARIWAEKLSQDEYYQTTIYGLAIWLERQDKQGKIRWGQDAKTCGICAQRLAAMTKARKTLAARGLLPIETLVVGNAKAIPPRNLDQFDCVVVFNVPTNKWALNWSTHHWSRGNNAAATTWGGQELIPLKAGMDVVLCDTLNNSEAKKAYQSKNCKVHDFRARGLCPDYPHSHCASTGFAAVSSYIAWGHKVTAMGFTWEGLNAHNWRWEKEQMREWQEQGKLKLIEVAP